MNTEIKDRYLRSLALTKRENTIKCYERDIRLFYEHIVEVKKTDSELDIIKLTTNDDIEDYQIYLVENNTENSTINRKLESLKHFFKYCCENKGLIERNPVVVSKMRVVQKEQDVLTLKEIKSVIESTYIRSKGDRCFEFKSARDRFLIALLTTTGLRIEEALNISNKDIEVCGDSYMVNIDASIVKNKIDKRVPICGETKKYYEEYIIERNKMGFESDIIILSNKGKKLTGNRTTVAIKKYVESANIDKDITNHSFRHSCSMILAKRGIAVDIIEKILGWSNKANKMLSYYNYDNGFDVEKINACNFL